MNSTVIRRHAWLCLAFVVSFLPLAGQADVTADGSGAAAETVENRAMAPFLNFVNLSQTPFSASVELSSTDAELDYFEQEKVYVSHRKLRRDLVGITGSMSSYIFDFSQPGKATVYALDPALKIYWEMSQEQPETGAAGTPLGDAMFEWDDAKWQRLSTQRVDGEKTIRYRYVADDWITDSASVEAWFTDRSQVLKKVTLTGEDAVATALMTDIKIAAQPPELFSVDADYARVDLGSYMIWRLQEPDAARQALEQGVTGDAVAQLIEQTASQISEPGELY